MTKQAPFPISIAFTAENIKKSIKFYREKLGFELAECFPEEKKPVWANMVLNGQSVMLGQALSAKDMKKQLADDKKAGEFWAEHARRFARVAHGVGVCVFLRVDDVDAFAKSVKSRRVKLDLQPKTQFYGLRECVVTDPDGYTLIFYTQVLSSEPCETPVSESAATPAEPVTEPTEPIAMDADD